MKEEAEKKHHYWVFGLIILLLLALYVCWALFVAKPVIKPLKSSSTLDSTIPAQTLAWPEASQSAVGINNYGVLTTNGQQKPLPMASTAKLVTALCVLAKEPLSLSQLGPTITISSSDVAIYNNYQAEDGSDLVVSSGEQLSEYQMLEAMLLPSADNIADSLAISVFGSLTAYDTYANNFLSDDGLTDTHIGSDASGFDPSNTTTASDLIKLGQLVMNNPVLAGIVVKTNVTGIPIVGTIKNVNFLVGKDSIVGIKTGNTDQAGGVYLSASEVSVDSQNLTVLTATMGAPTLFDAVQGSLPLITSAQSNADSAYSLNSGTVVGQYWLPWSHQYISAIVSLPLKVNAWGGSRVSESIKLVSITSKTRARATAGSASLQSALPASRTSTSIIISQAPTRPPKWWLLFHPLDLVHW